MNLIKSVLPEITFFTGAIVVFFSMWSIMGMAYAMFFLGAFLFIAAGFISSVMSVEIDETNS